MSWPVFSIVRGLKGLLSKYLGVPLHWQKLGSNDWDSLVSKIENRLQGWKEGEVKANDIEEDGGL